MISKSTLDKMTELEIVTRIKRNKEVMGQMVGQLYPSILHDETTQLIDYLYTERKYSWVSGKFYKDMGR
jgi:hypothetical protein